MIRNALYLVATVGALMSTMAPAKAAESFDNCTGYIDTLPATVSSQGTWCLRKDVSTAMTSGDAITVSVNNVIIDCNDFKIGGLAAGVGSQAVGVAARQRNNVIVRNCGVRGFLVGAELLGGGHVVEKSRFDSNLRGGIRIEGAGSMIRNNMVRDTGGATGAAAGTAYGILASGGVDILENKISGVAPAAASGGTFAWGIRVSQNSEGAVVGNRVGGLAAPAGGQMHGISNATAAPTAFVNNVVQGPGGDVTGSTGISCATTKATAHGNIILGFASAMASCFETSNSSNSN